MLKTAQCCLALCLLGNFPHAAFAGLVLIYTGEPFDIVQGTQITTSDRITGVVTFDTVGAEKASAFTLTASIGGGPGFVFHVPDAAAPPPGITVSQNSFGAWVNSVPTEWFLEVDGHVFGGAEEEQLGISSTVGDFAAIDLLSAEPSGGSNFVPGSFAAVPEPSVLCLTTVALGVFAWWRRRRPSKTTFT